MCKDKQGRIGRLLLGLLVGLMGIGTVPSLDAQILNIEQHRLRSDSSRFLFKGSLGMQLFNRSAAADDPVNLFGLNASVNAQYEVGRHAFIAIGQMNYLEINDNPWLNFGFAHLRGHLYAESATSLEIFGQYSYDNFRGLDPRMLLGANIRQRLTSGESVELTLGGGPMLEWERWQDPNTDAIREVSFVKLNTFLVIRKSLSEWVDLNAITYYQVGYDDGISALRHRWSGTVNINTRLSKRWSLNNAFQYSYEDKPIVPITRFIFDWRVGLSIDL